MSRHERSHRGAVFVFLRPDISTDDRKKSISESKIIARHSRLEKRAGAIDQGPIVEGSPTINKQA